MPFARPDLGELITRTTADFSTRAELLPGAAPTLRRSMNLIKGTVWAGAVHLLHGHLDWLYRQLFAKLAERESLIIRAAPYGIVPDPATFAGRVIPGLATGTGVDGSPVHVGTILKRSDGVKYTVTAEATVSSGAVLLQLQAVKAGSSGNAAIGTALSLESPVSGVNSSFTVVDEEFGIGIQGGADAETTDQLRSRFIARLRNPPEGGDDADYIAWARLVAGVTRAWVYRHELGLGTVVVRFVRDNDGDGPIPDSGEVAAVQAQLDAERPTTADVTAMAPSTLTVLPTLHIVPDNSTTRAAVVAALSDLFANYAEAGDGAGRGTVLLSKIRGAIGDAEGIDDYTLTSPSANVVPALGELPVLGSVNWV